MGVFATQMMSIYRLAGVFPLSDAPFATLAKAGPEFIRGFIKEIEALCDKGEMPHLEIPIENYFSKDVYAREMKLPAGTLVVGRIHRHENLNILSEGEVSVLDESGIKRFSAPQTFVAPPGVKRVIYAHSPVTWTTIHGTSSRDLIEIENEFVAKSYDDVVWLESQKEQKCLG